MSKKKNPELEKLEAQIAELTEALQRERADAVNVRRRADEDRTKLASFYKVMILRDLLPAVDNLERALKHTPKDLAEHTYIKGVQGVAKQFEQVFKELGVTRIKTIGEKFDPKLHNAVQMEEGEGGVEVVCEELQPGYRLGEDVLRHAMVKVRMEGK
jgi:molecular chaperone GrpE